MAIKEPQPMDESLEFIFNSMNIQKDIPGAIDFIRSIDIQYFPSKKVMNTIIFHILMKHDDVMCLSKATAYLNSLIKIYVPNNEERRNYYYDAVRESHGFLADLWNVFTHIVNSFFCHYEIYVTDGFGPEVIKYPNCKFLLEFYIRLFTVDLENYHSGSDKFCLLMHLLWPSGDICMSSRTKDLLKWINDMYSSPMVQHWSDLLKDMHDLLTLMVKCVYQGKHNLLEVAAVNDPCMMDIVEDITNICKNAFSNLNNVKLFISFLSLKCLQVRVIEKVIQMIIKPSSRPFSVLTLKEIVNQYMFPPKFNKWKTSKSVTNIKDKNLRKRTADKSVEKPSKMEITVLHTLCREKKFFDLMVNLKTEYEHINTRDIAGSTPLATACEVGNYMCVKTLVQEAGKGPIPKLDYTTGNLAGLTPLHFAVMTNNTQISRLLLNMGGSDLLNVTDNKGRRPADLDCSEEMEKLLQEFQVQSSTSEIDAFVENSQVKEAPTLKSFKDYSIYLHALNCLLCSYSTLFQLYGLAWKKTTFTQSHSQKMCCHFVNESFPCFEDAALLSELPDLIETFIQSLYKNVSKLTISIDLELLPLKAYKSSINASKH